MTKEIAGQIRIGISIIFDDADFDAAVALARSVPSHLADAFVAEFERLFVSSNLVTSTRGEQNGALVVCQIGGFLEICVLALAEAARRKERFLVIEGGKLTHLETRRFHEWEQPNKLLRGSIDDQTNFFTQALSAGGGPWITGREQRARKIRSRLRRLGRSSKVLLALALTILRNTSRRHRSIRSEGIEG